MTVPDSWTLDGVIEAFEQYQRRTRGLRDTTLHGYAPLVRGLIREGSPGHILVVEPGRRISLDAHRASIE